MNESAAQSAERPEQGHRTKLLLVRHGEVEERFRNVCYGRHNVALSARGLQQNESIAASLAQQPVHRLIHSGTQRTRHLAESLATRLGIRPECDVDWRERDFGSWELRSWDDLFAEVGDRMVGMMTEPATYRPGGGETTNELRDRAMAALARLPLDDMLTVVVTHGGPIASVLGTLIGAEVNEWPNLIPAYGCSVGLQADPRSRWAWGCANGFTEQSSTTPN